ncbi:chorismate mutase [Alkaliphilus peptidifermentans]|uniref:Shikimate kinase n=1 Tax=Alkaliphilus peptidifermentans DSM 18978 TaxID=1120976 RepID=A0A1G5D9S4_9FIRM|nr:chorismate mutase [Alkaliphilus peptidifermentans]SCY11462.1 shikimate kinase /chorismate mutase [Alkaliphilus peptidifermentans DSM 18978]
MGNLDELRYKIDQCDKALVEIFSKRLELVSEVLKYKKEKGLPILHPKREAEVIKKAVAHLNNPNYQQEIIALFEEVMRTSRRLQSKILVTQNIVLIGFMGSGKTTVGRELSIHMEMPFIDIDQLIEEEEKVTISEIFQVQGEDYFRRLESRMVKKISERKNSIISCGGGVILNQANIVELKTNGIIILLDAKEETIYNRIKLDSNRPLLKNSMDIKTIENIMLQRKEKYRESADIIINTDNKPVDEICKEIIEKLLTIV